MLETFNIISVAYASKILGINKVNVEFVSSDFIGIKTITSMYLPEHNLILFNQDWLTIAKLEDVILTAFHETRHAYQKSQIDGVPNLISNESQDTIKIWKTEFDNYYRPNSDLITDPKYIKQEIELDAIEFSNDLFR